MRVFCLLFAILGFAACDLPSHASIINGHEYVSVADWTRRNGCHVVSRTRERMILAGKSSRLVFHTGSAEAEINGVNVRLSFPAANDHGDMLVAQFDIHSALKPLLFPRRYVDHKKITTICLDPGHGGRDTGNRVHRIYWHDEKTYTLRFALELRKQLRRAGFKVIMTRTRDVYVGLSERPAIANKAGANLFISLHFNAIQVDKNSVHGIETYCITPVGAASSNAGGEGSNHGPVPANRWERRSLLFACQIQRSLTEHLHAADRDVRRARFAVLRDAHMPAILIEGGYMTNPAEGKKIFEASYRRQLAAAIVKGILAYQKLSAPGAVSSR